MKFTIPGELCDLNTFIKAANASRWGANEIKQVETTRCATMARNARLGAVLGYPVRVLFAWYSKDKRKDLDNICYSKKFVLDGLVQAGVLEDDSRKYVSGFADSFFVDKNNPRVEVEIVDDRLSKF
jgi:Holliday junction resolvase RusA-like endonuclease